MQDTDLRKTLYPWGLVDDGHVPVEEMWIPTHGPSAQYAITLFEGLMGYPIDGGAAIGVVAMRAHFQRLLDGAMKSDLGFNRDPERLERLVWRCMDEIENLILINDVKGPVYIRPTLYHEGTGNVCLGPALEGDIHLGVYLQKWDGYLKPKPEGQRVLISDYVKASSPVAHLKCSANYGLAIPAKREARRWGFDEILFLDERGMLAEASSQNLLIDLWDTIVTPTSYGGGKTPPILPGITLKILSETIAPDLGLKIDPYALPPHWLSDRHPDAPEAECQGIALCGTASEVQHVGSVSKIRGRDVMPGPRDLFDEVRRFERPSERIQALMDGYAKLTRGEAYRQWLTVVSL